MATPTIDRQTFLTHLLRSGLVSEEQLSTLTLPETERGRILARALVEQGVLTRFQAEMLLAGRKDGFHLGQYRILDQLGRGGMGRVFKAQHLTMNRVVALKVLASSLMRTPRARDLFQREVRAAAALTHPNIVTAFDANQAGDRHYLVMEYVDGPSLHELVKEQGPLPVAQACDYVRQAALGLQHAHEMGMVHRDLKPANLLVQRPRGPAEPPGGTVKILDFGLARLGESEEAPWAGTTADTIVTGGNAVMGTPDYLAPEQARNLHLADARSDLYSLGCTFYYLLTGRVPFPGGSSLEKLVRHGTEEPVPIENYRPDVPPAVTDIIRRLMAKKPEDRLQTAEELALLLTPLAVFGGIWVALETPLSPQTLGQSSADMAEADPFAFVTDDHALQATLPPGSAPTQTSTLSLFPIHSPLPRHDRPPSRDRIGLWLLLGMLAASGIGAALANWFLNR